MVTGFEVARIRGLLQCRLRSAVRADALNVSHLSQRVEVKHANVTGGARSRNIKIAAVRIGSHVIESAVRPLPVES